MLAQDGDDILALNNLADLLLDSGCTAEAQTLARRAAAAATDPAVPAVWQAAVADTAARAEACGPLADQR
jgi:hypothetical protein